MSITTIAQLHYDRLINQGRTEEEAIRMVNAWMMLTDLRNDGPWLRVAEALEMKTAQLSLYVNLKRPMKRETFDRIASAHPKLLSEGDGFDALWWEPMWGAMWNVVRSSAQ